jgi:hypothetical protein
MLITLGLRTAEPRAAVLPQAPFSVDPSRLPPVPTATATPVPRNTGAPGGNTVPKPCYTTPQSGHVVIPRICIDAQIVMTTIANGSLVIPEDVHHVGYWTGSQPIVTPDGKGGYTPGDTGTTLIAGHIDSIDQGNGALHDLYLVQPGESIYTTDDAGHTVRWRAVSMQVIEKVALPHSVFNGVTGPRRLVLVTCGGPLIHHPYGGSYRDNVIVTAIPG